MHKPGQPLLIFLLTAVIGGCSGAARGDPTRTKPTPIVSIDAFPAEYQEAAQAVAKSLVENDESVEEFYADVEPKEDGRILLFHLWHESAFEPRNRNVVGNPGGKCRDVRYDVRQRRVTQTLFWQ
jgi:hypothetical protein